VFIIISNIINITTTTDTNTSINVINSDTSDVT